MRGVVWHMALYSYVALTSFYLVDLHYIKQTLESVLLNVIMNVQPATCGYQEL